ncbi:helix-turn-helix domain-containing protein [Bacteroides finegoldii]|jgi:transcriptional regulator with XRE-family HTH domain|uniref:helix-turn-helix domain-containing protein n=1 Tax=Bacteroides finegoldii TaxID=338188 RepID=UPI00265D594A|nr:helix-turn-helix transcriptional regulator [Bacteroides finegoldii]
MAELRIKEVCKEKGVKIMDLSTMIGVSQTNTSNIINGKVNPSLETLEKIASALNVRITELFEEPTNINGYIELDGTIHKVSSKEDIKKLAEKL